MNKINRSLVKTQAKQIIKGKVFYLFIITFVVTILTGGVTSLINVGSSNFNFIDELFDNRSYNDNNLGDFDDYFEYNFGDDDFYFNDNNPIEDFIYGQGGDGSSSIIGGADGPKAIFTTGFPLFAIAGLGSLASIVALIFAPLAVTLAGMYLSLIRRNANESFDFGKEFAGIFKNSFNDTYIKKLVLQILVGLLEIGLSLLFIIPGIIFYYSAYFSSQIMNEYPNLKPSEAIKLSKKIIKGNRTELFVLDLSFIAWYLLMGITFGIVGIYVIPYVETTKALYYENFRLRALAEGRITEDDFLSDEERMMKYNGYNMNNQYQQGYNYSPDINTQQYTQYQAPQQNAVNNNGTFYTPDFSPVQQYPPYAPQAQPYQQQGNAGYYYNPQPPQYAQPQSPEQPQYYNTVEPAQPTEPQYYNPPSEETGESIDTDNNE